MWIADDWNAYIEGNAEYIHVRCMRKSYLKMEILVFVEVRNNPVRCARQTVRHGWWTRLWLWVPMSMIAYRLGCMSTHLIHSQWNTSWSRYRN